MSFNYSPKIVTKNLCFYVDTLNTKCRDRNSSSTGGTVVDLVKGGEMSMNNGITISPDYKEIQVDGVDDYLRLTSGERKQPFVRSKPSTLTMSFWLKTGTTNTAGILFFAGTKDYTLDYNFTGTSYTPGVYSNVPGANLTSPSKTVPNFDITIGAGGVTVTNVLALSAPHNSLTDDVILITGDNLGGSSPADDALFYFRSATSSNSRYGMSMGVNFGAVLSDNVNRGSFGVLRADNEPNEWNNIVFTDEGQLLTEGNRKIYVNGELKRSSEAAETTFLNESWMKNPIPGAFFIGKGGSTFSATTDGSIGTVMLYDRALSAEEVLQNYDAIKNRYM